MRDDLASELRDMMARYLALALRAVQGGHIDISEELVVHAIQCDNKANALEAAYQRQTLQRKPPGMPVYPDEWRQVLELLAGSANGCSASLLSAHGFRSEVIAGLVDRGLATISTERILAGEHPIEVTWFKITNAGRLAREA
jgi:hypothetical protein